ncbi:HNH endonuclease [bacterium]|nr:HNH endonuclease [bacterium]
MGKYQLKSCEKCGNTIEKKSNGSWNTYNLKRFCSIKCANGRNNKQVGCECEYCGNRFFRSPSHAKRNKHTYCNPKCRHLGKTKLIECGVCGIEIRKPKSLIEGVKDSFCSHKCSSTFMRRNRGQNQGRRSPEDRKWKWEIHKRDGYKCTMCGDTELLEAHHIKPCSEYPKLRHELSNGITVCHECHYYKIHNGAPNYKHGRYSKRGTKVIL